MDVSKNLAKLLAGLPPDISIDRSVQHGHSLELFVSWPEPGRTGRQCPACGSGHCTRKDNGALQTLRHVPCAGQGILLTFHKPRFSCRNCGKSFYVKPPWAAPDMSITTALFLDIYARLTSSSRSIREIAADTMTSPSIVRNVMGHVRLGVPDKLPETLGIDEFHGDTGTYNRERKRYDTEKFHCVVTDAQGGYVIDILYKATFQELKDYFMKFSPYERGRVKYFCTDLRSGFTKVARACFPHAKVCLDPFHVVQLLTTAISSVRTDEWQRLRTEGAKVQEACSLCSDPGEKAILQAKAEELEASALLVKNSQRILTTSPYNDNRYWNRNDTLREERLTAIAAVSPGLALAREVLLGFYDVCHADPIKRRALLSDWMEAYGSCEIPQIRKAVGTIRERRPGIENAWRFHKSNSPTEGINKRIKDVKRMAFGAHDFESFRKRAMLACGCVTFLEEPYTLFREKASGPPAAGRKEETGHVHDQK